MNAELSPASLLRLLPPIRRARDYRLYAEDGSRFLDLWQDGGRGVLGAKGTGLGTILKAEVDKGRAKPLPSLDEARLEKEILSRWPAFTTIRFYANAERAEAAIARAFGQEGKLGASGALGDGASALVFDPARREAPEAGNAGKEAPVLLIRPFGEHLMKEGQAAKYRAADFRAAALLLPCPATFAPAPLLFSKAEDAADLGGDLIAPLALACAYRSLREYGAYSKRVDEAFWRRADRRIKALFERVGPFLYPRCPPEAYGELFAQALKRGVLLSPDYGLPSMLPGEFDDGELKKLSSILL
jgi:hypothetical protein